MNTDYFKIIDTKEKAYWLGFLYADGYISRNNKRVQICLAIQDEIIIDRFIHAVNGNPEYKKQYGPYQSNKQIQIHFYINNEEFVNNIISHGCVNKKSKIIRFPIIKSYDLQLAFLLGYFDGDGDTLCTLTCGSRLFLDDIKSIFKIENVVSKTNNKYETYRLRLGNLLYREMISNYEHSLDRKRHNLDNVMEASIYREFIKENWGNYKNTHTIERQQKFKITKNELEELLIKYPFTEIGKMYGVSDNAIRKRCKKMVIKIPEYPKGYWLKK